MSAPEEAKVEGFDLDLTGLTDLDCQRIRWLARMTGHTHVETIRAAVSDLLLVVVSQQTQNAEMAEFARERLHELRAGRGQA